MVHEKNVRLLGMVGNQELGLTPEDLVSAGARGCFDESCSMDIALKEKAKLNYQQRLETIFRETSGRGHGAVLDQAVFCFSLDNLTRASTLFLCSPHYASHLQQSLRRATAERGFHEEGLSSEAIDIMNAQFKLYSEMQATGIPAEDARYILPLNTKTAIQTMLSARELMHLYSMSKRPGVPSEVRDTLERMYQLARDIAPRLMEDRGTNFEILSWYPSLQLFGEPNQTLVQLITFEDSKGVRLFSSSSLPMTEEAIRRAIVDRDEAELANLKHYHFTFGVRMSIAALHQAIRQRTWDQSTESLPQAARSAGYSIPGKVVRTPFDRPYSELSERAIKFYNQHPTPENLGVLPHNLFVWDLIHVNGWNAVTSIGVRTCIEAQWEIRNKAKLMAKEIIKVSPELGKYAVPRGVTYGKCPERDNCGLCEKLGPL